MQFIKLVGACSISLFSPLLAQAQGTFQNLDFEQADPIPAPNTPFVTAASALPGWTVTFGSVQQTQITENDPATGSTWVMLAGPNDPTGYPPLDGNYSVLLQGGITASAAAISQTAVLPASANSLVFEAAPGLGTLDVSIGSQNIPFAETGTGPNYNLYEANISAWSDDPNPVTLTFSALEGLNNWEIDDISFSATPEPSPLILTGIGGLLFGLCRHLRPNRS